MCFLIKRQPSFIETNISIDKSTNFAKLQTPLFHTDNIHIAVPLKNDSRPQCKYARAQTNWLRDKISNCLLSAASLRPSLFIYYHSAGCQLVHERFAQHEILHVDRINQKEEIKVGRAPKWLALCAAMSLVSFTVPHHTHTYTLLTIARGASDIRPNMAASAACVCYYQSTQQIN
jgi:hypothetical protein